MNIKGLGGIAQPFSVSGKIPLNRRPEHRERARERPRTEAG